MTESGHDQSRAGAPKPLGDEKQFARTCNQMVAALAPRVFALLEEYGERWDARIVAWGMAFDDRVEIAGNGSRWRGSFESAEYAQAAFASDGKVHLVWADPGRTGRSHAAAGE